MAASSNSEVASPYPDTATVTTAAATAGTTTIIATLLIHLRLPFQLLLAPIFLWGILLAHTATRASLAVPIHAWLPVTILAFVAFHVCNYGGGTAFNSYYDRDEGPIGGLAHPPPVVRALLPFALALQLIGWACCAAVNSPVFVVYGLMFALFITYSHPRIRLKAHPYLAMATVAFGQGILGFWAGWLTLTGSWSSLTDPVAVVGAVGAMLATVGLYPLTQVYQIDEDRARGDRTIAVVWGVRGSFVLAGFLLLIAGVCLAGLVGHRYGLGDAVLMGGSFVAMLVALAYWLPRFDALGIYGNARVILRLNTVSSAGFTAYILYHLISPG